MSKRLNPPGVLPVTEIIKNEESVLQNLSAQLDWNISFFEITQFTAVSLSTFSGRSGHVLFFHVWEKLLLLRLACVQKGRFCSGGHANKLRGRLRREISRTSGDPLGLPPTSLFVHPHNTSSYAGYVTSYHVSLASSQWGYAMLGYILIKRYGKTDDKNLQLMFCNIAALKRVEKRCCAFYRLQFKPVLPQIRLLQVAWILRLLFRNLQEPDLFSEGRFDSWVVKRATSLFNSFCSNVAKQVAGFCCPFLP